MEVVYIYIYMNMKVEVKWRAAVHRRSVNRTGGGSEVDDLSSVVGHTVLSGLVPVGEEDLNFTQDQNEGNVLICLFRFPIILYPFSVSASM